MVYYDENLREVSCGYLPLTSTSAKSTGFESNIPVEPLLPSKCVVTVTKSYSDCRTVFAPSDRPRA